jgi:hypothetical protein
LKGGSLLPVIVAGLVPIALLALLFLGAGLQLVAWRPPLLWSDQFGVQEGDNGAISASANSNGLFLTGYLNSTASLAGGEYFVRRYDLGGGLLWTQTFPNTPDSAIGGVSVGTDGAYEALWTNETFTILKYALNGSLSWSRQIGGQVGIAFATPVIFASASGEYVAGDVYNQSSSQKVGVLRDYDPGGNVIWTIGISGAIGIYADSSGIYVLTGESLVAYALNGTELWTRTVSDFAPSGFSGDSAGLYVSGWTAYNFPGTGYLAKYDPDGNRIWEISFESPSGLGVGNPSVAASSSGVVVEMADGGTWANKYDDNGHQVWSFETDNISPHGVPLLSSVAAAWEDSFYELGSGQTASVAAFSEDSSVVFFGVNPPWSFLILGGVLAGAVGGFFVFRREQRKRKRPLRIGPPERALPVKD